MKIYFEEEEIKEMLYQSFTWAEITKRLWFEFHYKDLEYYNQKWGALKCLNLLKHADYYERIVDSLHPFNVYLDGKKIGESILFKNMIENIANYPKDKVKGLWEIYHQSGWECTEDFHNFIMVALLGKIIDIPEEPYDDEEPLCSYCNGCGEGSYDGARCSHCKGSGVEPSKDRGEW
jgi:hypothetical protein